MVRSFMKAANKDLFSDAILGRSTASSSWQFPINGERWHDLDKNAPEESVFISQLYFWTSFHVNGDTVDQQACHTGWLFNVYQ